MGILECNTGLPQPSHSVRQRPGHILLNCSLQALVLVT